ncbi:MAG: histidine--tRNA ligase [Nitrospiraceae bacterium]|nr:histidine--tRNA ligase [Nitrospiraceae bacterium]
MSFQSPKGTYDIIPTDQPYWEKIRKVTQTVAKKLGFLQIETPVFEDARIYIRSIGKKTDIVEKEMFFLKKQSEKSVDFVLRPEFTAGVVRAYLQDGLVNYTHPLKLWYEGPVFRHEQPQSGRFRQFHQFGLEIFGGSLPVTEALLIKGVFIIFEKIGLKNISLKINSLGCDECRKEYRQQLVSYYKKHQKEICDDCRRRLKTNPLRVLDCKNPKCQEVIHGAPKITSFLCDDCQNHFHAVLELLDELNVPYSLDEHLVRGLDYYTRTVFEFVANEKSGNKELSIGGGGRYDNLVKVLGGKSTSAIGLSLGLDRIVSLMKAQKVKVNEWSPKLSIFIVSIGKTAQKKALELYFDLLKKGFSIGEAFARGSLKSQLRAANKSGAKIALIMGQQEVNNEVIMVRDLISSEQEEVPLKKLIKEIKKRLKNK